MKKDGLLASYFALVLAAATGCGKVTVETTADGGGEGGGGTTTSSATDPASYCPSLCQQLDTLCGSSVPECIDACTSAFEVMPGCESQLIDVYECLKQGMIENGCDGPTLMLCQPKIDVLNECLNTSSVPTAPCGETFCDDVPDGCQCESDCDSTLYSVSCQSTPDGVFCECSMDGELVGECSDAAETCDVYEGCCSVIFF